MRSLITKLMVVLLGLSVAAQAADPEERAALVPREIVERTDRAVVQIEVKQRNGTRSGSGFIVDEDGVIVTNLHVLDGAERVRISLPGGMRFDDATVQAFDVEKDLAVLRVELPPQGPELPAVQLGDATSLRAGEAVVVIGYPLGLEQTVTEGVVSALRQPKERTLQGQGSESGLPLLRLECRLIQFSAPVSRGNSGGPVLNDRAEVVGVVSFVKLDPGLGATGLNFAVSVDELLPLLDADEAMDLATFRGRADRARLELARPHLELAETLIEEKEAQKALRALERARTLCPNCEEALLLGGRILMAAGRPEQAESWFRAALTASEESAEAWYLLGSLYGLKADDINSKSLRYKAREHYEKAIILDPWHARAAFGLAMLVAEEGMLDEAEDLLTRAVEAEPELADARYLLGEVYLEQGRIEEAERAFEETLWEERDHALSHFGLARLYTVRDQTPHGAALHHWEAFLRLSESDPVLRESRRDAIRILEPFHPRRLEW